MHVCGVVKLRVDYRRNARQSIGAGSGYIALCISGGYWAKVGARWGSAVAGGWKGLFVKIHSRLLLGV